MDNNYLQKILNNFPNPIWMSGTDAACNFFNHGWLNFTGRSLEQEVGNGWTEGVHPDDFDACVQGYTKAFEARESFRLEYRVKHKDGTFHWIVDFGAPHYDESGEFQGYIGSCYDEQEMKSNFDIISKQRDELEKMNKYMVGRENRMKELKKEIEILKNNNR